MTKGGKYYCDRTECRWPPCDICKKKPRPQKDLQYTKEIRPNWMCKDCTTKNLKDAWDDDNLDAQLVCGRCHKLKSKNEYKDMIKSKSKLFLQDILCLRLENR